MGERQRERMGEIYIIRKTSFLATSQGWRNVNFEI
jgi:hypothetical protein